MASDPILTADEPCTTHHDACACRERAIARRFYATTYERTAWHHDTGEHQDSDAPFAFCPRCEMEHPKGRFAVLTREVEALRTERDTLRDGIRVWADAKYPDRHGRAVTMPDSDARLIALLGEGGPGCCMGEDDFDA